jgi:transposase
MIKLTRQTPILLALAPADFRSGIDGFVAVCRRQLKQNPNSGTLFVFINRNKTMIRALTYDGTGFWLMTKRLSKGKFTSWPKGSEPISKIAAIELKQILSGHDRSRFSQIHDD